MTSAQQDEELMRSAVALAAGVRSTTSPNPWVGCVVATPDGATFEGATQPPGGDHAEIVALAKAGAKGAGATLYSTLEPCAHHGRTPPCTDAIVAAGVARVVVAVGDPDPLVEGKGIEQLRAAGVTVDVGLCAEDVSRQLQPYLKHRITGRPWVVLKLAATLDGRTAAPDGTSQWITGEAARNDAHRLRSESDAVLIGAGTVRTDDPSLTVRLPTAGAGTAPIGPGSDSHTSTGTATSTTQIRSDAATEPDENSDNDTGTTPPRTGTDTSSGTGAGAGRQPHRVVLGTAPPEAKVHPAWQLSGDLGDVLDDLGQRGIVQLLVEGGATVAHGFHAAGLVDRYVFYLAPALMGGGDGRPLFAGPGAPTIDDIWRGRIVDVTTLGTDIRIELASAGTA